MKRKRIFNRVDQSLWNCIIAGLAGLKRCEWLTLQEYEHIIIHLQKAIDRKTEDIM